MFDHSHILFTIRSTPNVTAIKVQHIPHDTLCSSPYRCDASVGTPLCSFQSVEASWSDYFLCDSHARTHKNRHTHTTPTHTVLHTRICMHTTTCIPLSYCTSAAARRSRNETQAGPESVGSNGTKWSVLTKSERERQRKRERARESLLVTKLREVLAALVSLFVVVPFPIVFQPLT